jgi:ankyrin repeat protein
MSKEEANKLLLDSAMNNDLAGVKKALEQGADINALSQWDGSALHIAASKGFIDIAKLLLKSGADSALLAMADFTPLHIAARDGQLEIVALLLDKGGPYTDRLLVDVGQVASMSVDAHPATGDLIRRQRIRQLKPDVEDHSEEDKLLFDAVYNGDLQGIEKALVQGADVNARDDRDLTILRWAVRRNYLDVVKLLLEKNAEINDVSNMGWSALMEASMGGYTEIAEFLIKNGADVNLKTTVNGTALYFASYEGFVDMVKLLLDNGADPTVEVDTSGFDYDRTDTALTIAVAKGHTEIVNLLKKSNEYLEK